MQFYQKVNTHKNGKPESGYNCCALKCVSDKEDVNMCGYALFIAC